MLELPLGNVGWENPLVGENPARKQQKKNIIVRSINVINKAN